MRPRNVEMCLLALFFRAVEDAPIVVGAIREEFFARGGEPPRVLEGRLRSVAGIDPVAGGTWMGVNERGLIVAVTNRRKSQQSENSPSRGLLVRELLLCDSAEVAIGRAIGILETKAYAGCNILCADRNTAVALQAGDWLRVRPLPPGLHVLTNRDVNDTTDARLQSAAHFLGQQPCYAAENCVQAFRRLSVQREPPDLPICFRDGERGTVSATIVAVRQDLAASTYLHAQGSPDRTPYADYSNLMREMTEPRSPLKTP